MAITALILIDVDPERGNDHSPTVWVAPDIASIVIQGWEADADLLDQVAAAPAPDHVPGFPVGEAVIRIPARIVSVLRRACDAAEHPVVR